MREKFAQALVLAGIALLGLRGVLPELVEAGWLQEMAPKAWTLFAAVVISGSSVALVLAFPKIYDRIRNWKRGVSPEAQV